MRQRRYFAAFLLAATIVVACPTAARAYLIISWDIDTFINRSTAIVEGEVSQAQDRSIQLSISHVYRGDMKEGATVAVDDIPFRGAPDSPDHPSANFAIGDHLICFLGPDDSWNGEKARPDGSRKWKFYGMRMVHAGKVVDFSNVGERMVADVYPQFADLQPQNARVQPALEDFRKSLTAAIQKDDAAIAAIRQATAAKDSRQLLTIAGSRPPEVDSMKPGEDRLLRAAVDGLVELHDYPVLADALLLKNARAHLLQAGFYTPAGRAFLLQTIADRKVELPKRLACASVLPYHGLIENPPGTFDRDPHYFARLAQLAADNGDAPELCVALAGSVGYFGNMAPPFNADIQAGMDILTRLYPTTANQTIRYCIEGALRSNSEAAYAALAAPGGPVIAIVQPDAPAQFDKPVGRNFRVRLAWEMYFGRNESHTLQTEIFLQPLAGGEPIPAGPGSPLTGPSPLGGSTYQPITLPTTLPAGKYRLYVQFSEGGKIVGQSHALDIDFQPH